jgi:biopolymer transport protein TolR
MSMAVGNIKGPKSDINITPYIDILLVMLIIFMVITPVHQMDLKVKVPQPAPKEAEMLPPDPSVIVVSLDEKLNIKINQDLVTVDALGTKLVDIYKARANKNMFISANSKLLYGDVVKIIDIAKGSGVGDIGLLTEMR